MTQPSIINATVTLLMLVGALIGLSYLIRRFGLAPRLQEQLRVRSPTTGQTVIRIDRFRRLSIVQLDGCRFAILTGGRSDQLLIISDTARSDCP
jgi:hypothetical protein